MYFYLFDRGDRLGANIINYLTQILYAFNNKYLIKFNKKKEEYSYYNSIFVKTLFNYIEKYNDELKNIKNNHHDDEYFFTNTHDYITTTSDVLKNIQFDFITFFYNNIYNDIKTDFKNLVNYDIPFDINKTILVHLRLDDVAKRPDYDGTICSNYYKNKIKNNENCVCEFYETINNQAPLSKQKMDYIIMKKDLPTFLLQVNQKKYIFHVLQQVRLEKC